MKDKHEDVSEILIRKMDLLLEVSDVSNEIKASNNVLVISNINLIVEYNNHLKATNKSDNTIMKT